MKRLCTQFVLLCSTLFIYGVCSAQQDWPKTIQGGNGEILKIYQPQPESFSANVLKSRSAISILENGKSEPVFGMFWSSAELGSGDEKNYQIQSFQVTALKFPAAITEAQLSEIRSTLQSRYPTMNISLSRQEIQQALNSNQAQQKLSTSFNNTPPKVIYTTQPSTLVVIDGYPKLQMNNDWGLEAVVNTPFTIVKNGDGNFYLYGGKRWYRASTATGPYSYTGTVPDDLLKVQTAINNAAEKNDNNKNDLSSQDINIIPQIIVSTEPAELIQSNGEPNFSPIEGTGLLYVKNSSNDIFMDVNSQQYFVLLSGRWYKAPGLRSQWQYIAADKLPGDFAKIPEGSSKDNVLANVAGTEAANNAVMEAQVPQTAKVDRKTATAHVAYDGDPEFERISGTHLQYAVNGSGTVLRLNGSYYTVENGVWFEAGSPTGPWYVSTTRPDDVDLIPPGYPVYNVKYVYIYDVTPDYVYMGYTPGYLNTYIYGPTIVYGTGYYYRPWFRHYYYPRPYTWGFNMNYDPWVGWGFGFNYNFGWLDIGFGSRSWGYPNGGWWGPSVYRPPYCGNYYDSYGYYGNRGYEYRNSVNINLNYSNNIYRYRRDVVSTDNRRYIAPNNGNNFNGRREGPGNNNSINRFPDRNRFNNNTNPTTDRRFQGNIDPRMQGRNNLPQNNGTTDRRFQGNIDPRPQTQNTSPQNNGTTDRRFQGNIDPRPQTQNTNPQNNGTTDRRFQGNIDPRPQTQNTSPQNNGTTDRRFQGNIDPRPQTQNTNPQNNGTIFPNRNNNSNNNEIRQPRQDQFNQNRNNNAQGRIFSPPNRQMTERPRMDNNQSPAPRMQGGGGGSRENNQGNNGNNNNRGNDSRSRGDGGGDGRRRG